MIISAKHGLVSPSETLEPYDKVLKTKRDIEDIKPNVIENLKKILPNYNKIIVIAGEKYRKTIESIIDSRFEIVTAAARPLLQEIYLKNTNKNIL